jgi:hypothetical protein
VRRDILAEFASQAVTWAPGGSLEVGRALSPRLAVVAAYAAALHTGDVQAPGAGDMAPDFIRLFVPELAFYGSDALAQRAGLTLRWATGPASAVYARARWGHVAPVGERMWPDVAPAGARSGWGVAVGALW